MADGGRADGAEAEDGAGAASEQGFDVIAVSRRGRVVFVARRDVEWVEAAGDYVRLHTRPGESYLLRLPLGTLESAWARHGFARVHRRFLVALPAVHELRTTPDGAEVRVGMGDQPVPVSRRRRHRLRTQLMGGINPALRPSGQPHS